MPTDGSRGSGEVFVTSAPPTFDNWHHADWLREMNRVERADNYVVQECSALENNRSQPDNRFPLTGWPYTVKPEDEPYKRQEAGSHYLKYPIQPTEYIIKNNLNFCEGNVVKYVTRWKDKGGLDDLKKARHYLDMMIEEHSK